MSEPNANKPETTKSSTAVSEKPKPPASKSAPARAPSKSSAKKGEDRRFFLLAWFGSWFAVAWWSFSISILGMVLGTIRFFFPNVLSEPPNVYRAGAVNDYEQGQVSTQFKEQGFWIVRAVAPVGQGKTQDIIYALSTICTHLGCNPNWLETDKKFKCPCHGSGFYINGINFEGPAPRPLERFSIHKTPDGQVIVDKSKKFQFERGEWENPESYLNA